MISLDRINAPWPPHQPIARVDAEGRRPKKVSSTTTVALELPYHGRATLNDLREFIEETENMPGDSLVQIVVDRDERTVTIHTTHDR